MDPRGRAVCTPSEGAPPEPPEPFPVLPPAPTLALLVAESPPAPELLLVAEAPEVLLDAPPPEPDVLEVDAIPELPAGAESGGSPQAPNARTRAGARQRSADFFMMIPCQDCRPDACREGFAIASCDLAPLYANARSRVSENIYEILPGAPESTRFCQVPRNLRHSARYAVNGLAELEIV